MSLHPLLPRRKKTILIFAFVIVLIISCTLIGVFVAIRQSHNQTHNFFSQPFLHKLIQRSKRYGVVKNGDEQDNRYYRKVNDANPSEVVDNDISDNNLSQFTASSFLSRFVNLQSAIPLVEYRNVKSIDSADYQINFPFAIPNPISGTPTCCLQFNNANPFSLFNNSMLPPFPNASFPTVQNAVYYLDTSLDNAPPSSYMARNQAPLAGLYIFYNPRYICIYSFLTAYGGVPHGYKNVYPNLYSLSTKLCPLLFPFQKQNFTSFWSFQTSSTTSQFLVKLICRYLCLKHLFQAADENNPNNHTCVSGSPIYSDEVDSFNCFQHLFSSKNLQCLMSEIGKNNKLIALQGVTTTTTDCSALQPLPPNPTPNYRSTDQYFHEYTYQNFNNNNSIKYRIWKQCFSVTNIHIPAKLAHLKSFYSCLFLVNQANFGVTDNSSYWWQPYLINTVKQNGTILLSEFFSLFLQNPGRFDFPSGNVFDYHVPVFRSANINNTIIAFLLLDSLLFAIAMVLGVIYRVIYRHNISVKYPPLSPYPHSSKALKKMKLLPLLFSQSAFATIKQSQWKSKK